MRHRKSGGNSKVKLKYHCGNCAKVLGKGSRQKPSIWCNICVWVHFTCSGLKSVDDYKKSRDFFCTKCAVTRKIVNPTAESLAYSRIHTFYTFSNNPAAFAGRNALKKTSNCSYRQVDNYLNRSKTYTKFKQTRNHFARLKVQSFRLNEIWSIDFADMQKLSRYNHGINFIFVAVDTQPPCLGVTIEKKTAEECKDALHKIMESLRSKRVSAKRMMMMKPKFCRSKSNTLPKPEKIWVDKGREFTGEVSHFCREKDIGLYSTHSETKSAFAERNIRSLKAIIFKFLHENNTDTYIENLQQFVNVINCRVNQITKFAPKDVGKNDVPYLISLQCCNQIRQPKYKMGQQ